MKIDDPELALWIARGFRIKAAHAAGIDVNISWPEVDRGCPSRFRNIVLWVCRMGVLPPEMRHVECDSGREIVGRLSTTLHIGFVSVEEKPWHLMNLRYDPDTDPNEKKEENNPARSKLSKSNLKTLHPIDSTAFKVAPPPESGANRQSE